MKFKFKPGKFYQTINEQLMAEITFTIEQNVLSINHTFVDPTYRGQGVAGQLMLAVINYAQKEQLLIHPVCSYAQEYFKHHPEYQKLLKDNN